VPSDELLRAALEHTLGGLRAPLDASLRAFADELRRHWTAETDAAVRAAVESAVAQSRQQADVQLAAFQHDADQKIETVRREGGEHLESVRRAVEADLASTRAAAQAEIERVRREAEAELSDLRDRSAAEIANVRRQAAEELEESRRLAQAHADDVQRGVAERAAISRDLEEALRVADDARRITQASRDEGDDLRRQLETARAEIEDARQRDAQGAMLHDTRMLLDGVRSLDEARGLGDVLDRLVRLQRREAERLAVFVLRGDRLQEWRAAGFAERGPSERRDVALGEAGILTEVVHSGRPVIRLDDGPLRGSFPEGAEGRAAAALPITVGGAVVAVLYTDTARAETSAEGRWPAMFEVLVRHASRVLEAITIQRAAGLLPPAGPAAPLASGTRQGERVQ
jgi:hypothetical protein